MTIARGGYLVVGVLFALLYASTFSKLVASWMANDTYSYGFLVPLISVYLVWIRRDALREIPQKPSLFLGSLTLLAGLMMLVVGRVSSTNLVEGVSIVVTIAGAILLLLGLPMLRALAFPVAYLLTMVPFWDFVTNRIHPQFQMYSASVGVAALRLFGIPVYRHGIFIELPDITLEVAELCSGVNNLVAVLCIGIPVTYIFVRNWWKRALIITVAVLIALLSNGIRVAMVSVFAYYGIRGADGDVHGPYSLLRAMLISGVGFVVLFWLIARFSDSDPNDEPRSEPRQQPAPVGYGSRLRAVAAAVVIFAVFFGFDRWHEVQAVPLRGSFFLFPQRIATWESTSAPTFDSDLERIEFDQKLSRNYRHGSGAELNVFIGYFENQQQGSRELVNYDIRGVLNTPAHATYRTSYGSGRPVRDFLTTRGNETFHETYWYTVNGTHVSEDYAAKLYTAWSAIAQGTNNGGIVVVKSKVPANMTIEQARARVGEFVEGLMVASKDYLPER